MKSLGLVIAVALLTAGCQTVQRTADTNDLWIGQEEILLVRVWGVPDRTYETSGHRFVVYVSQRTVTNPGVPGTYIAIPSGSGPQQYQLVGGIPPSTQTYTCETTFELVGTRIVGWQTSGSGCRSLPPPGVQA